MAKRSSKNHVYLEEAINEQAAVVATERALKRVFV